MKIMKYKFLEIIPDKIDNGTLYISLKYNTVVHKCCCGCGREVVTPLSPKDWKLIFDGESISLYPSIGNWNYPCKSHYWITENKIRWAKQLSTNQIINIQGTQKSEKISYFNNRRLSSFFTTIFKK
jgi:Family of unknown function (DUF6527)